MEAARQQRLRGKRNANPSGTETGPQTGAEGEPAVSIERWKREFAGMSYNVQLDYLTDMERELRRRLGSHQLACDAIARHFEPLLKTPGVTVTTPPDLQSRGLDSGDPSRAILQLVARRPGELYQKQCAQLLSGSTTDPAARRDTSFGICAWAGSKAIRVSVRSLLARGELVLGPTSKLVPGKHAPAASPGEPKAPSAGAESRRSTAHGRAAETAYGPEASRLPSIHDDGDYKRVPLSFRPTRKAAAPAAHNKSSGRMICSACKGLITDTRMLARHGSATYHQKCVKPTQQRGSQAVDASPLFSFVRRAVEGQSRIDITDLTRRVNAWERSRRFNQPAVHSDRYVASLVLQLIPPTQRAIADDIRRQIRTRAPGKPVKKHGATHKAKPATRKPARPAGPVAKPAAAPAVQPNATTKRRRRPSKRERDERKAAQPPSSSQ